MKEGEIKKSWADFYQLKKHILLSLCFTYLIVVIFLLIYALFIPSNYIVMLYIHFINLLILFTLIKKRKYELMMTYILISMSLVLILHSYTVNSGATYSLLSVLLIICAIFKNFRFTSFLFISYILILLLFVITGKFTVGQTLVPPTNTALANNIQTAIPAFLMSYLLSYVISNYIISSLNYQKKQNKELKNTQNLLISQARIDSIRLLAGGFAHDFNNILTSILGNISLSEISEDLEEIKHYLKDGKEACLHARNLSNQLLTFTRHSTPSFKTIFDVTELVDTTANFSLKGRKSQHNLIIGKNLHGFKVDPIQISQVIQNLIINADESMETGGVIDIVIKNYDCGTENSYGLKPGKYIKINVIDSGIGIEEKIQDKIFKIFFSTKKTGTGLGLAICKNIIKNHKGYIGFKSEMGKGTNFHILLPALEYTKHIEKKLKTLLSSEKYEGLVLIYDDNRNIINVLSSICKKMGLTPIGASESTSFINLMDKINKDNKKPSLFIVDLTIPGDTSGKDMIKIIKDKWADNNIVISSGYSDDLISDEIDSNDYAAILKKPYTIQDVQNIFHEIFKN